MKWIADLIIDWEDVSGERDQSSLCICVPYIKAKAVINWINDLTGYAAVENKTSGFKGYSEVIITRTKVEV